MSGHDVEIGDVRGVDDERLPLQDGYANGVFSLQLKVVGNEHF